MISEQLIIDRGNSAGDDWITVPAESVRDALAALRSDGYRLLTFLTCVDHLADSSREWPARFEMVYQLRDLETRFESLRRELEDLRRQLRAPRRE